jgi:hypothetical protein
MLQPVSVGLKFGFLIVLYLFLVWVVATALFDLRRSSPVLSGRRGRRREATGVYAATEPLLDDEGEFEPRLVVDQAPGHDPGLAYDISDGATLGRGDVEIQLDDPFASSRHARISRQGRTMVIEDLGSTNGTYLNDEPLTGPRPLHEGDQIRIGDCEFSFFQ